MYEDDIFVEEMVVRRKTVWNLLLTAAAIISATAAASHLCFYGSESTLACSAAQIDNVRYAQTSIPMLMVPFLLSAVCFLGAGFLFG